MIRYFALSLIGLSVGIFCGCDAVQSIIGEGEEQTEQAQTAPRPKASTPASTTQAPRDFIKEMYLDDPRHYDVEPRSELAWLGSLQEGLEISQKEERPLLVMLHCPQGTRSGSFDETLLNPSPALSEKLRQFITVDLDDITELDLNRFRFPDYQDPDQTWWLWIIGPSGNFYSVYGLEGEESAQADIESRVIAWMERVLTHHYDPRRKDWERDHEPVPPAEAISTLENQDGFQGWTEIADKLSYLRTSEKCLCCHQGQGVLWFDKHIRDNYERRVDSWIWPPLENLGISLEEEKELVVKEVAAGSLAEQAGFLKGDRLCELDEKRIFSRTDISGKFNEIWDFPAVLYFGAVREDKFQQLRIPLKNIFIRRYRLIWRESLKESVLATHPGFIPQSAPQGLEEKIGVPIGMGIIPLVGKASPAWERGLRPEHVIISFPGAEEYLTPRDFLTTYSILMDKGVPARVKIFDQKDKKIRHLMLPSMFVYDLPVEAIDRALLRAE